MNDERDEYAMNNDAEDVRKEIENLKIAQTTQAAVIAGAQGVFLGATLKHERVGS